MDRPGKNRSEKMNCRANCNYKSGKIIEVFKTKGGKATARRENLKLLATLPLEVEVVRAGDSGDVGLLDNKSLILTREFDRLVNEIVQLTSCRPSSLDQGGKGYISAKISNYRQSGQDVKGPWRASLC